jgi:predicted transposase/invertase (TIGR01784 family)
MSQTHIRFDWAIKKLLRNKANFEILEGFLSELLFEDIFIQEIIESNSNKESTFDKSNTVDILVKNSQNQLMLIEVQNEKEHDYFHRMNYGQAKIITEHIVAGDKYAKVIKVYSINIVYFDLGHGDDYIYKGETSFKGIHTHSDLELSAKQKELYKLNKPNEIFATYYLLRLNNFNDIAKDTLDEWIYFLKNSEIKDTFKAKGLAKAKESMRVDSMNRDEKIAYNDYIKVERIRMGEIDTAIEDGKDLAKKELLPLIEEERRQKEEAKALLKTAIIQFQTLGLEIDKIASILNKPVSEIKQIIE